MADLQVFQVGNLNKANKDSAEAISANAAHRFGLVIPQIRQVAWDVWGVSCYAGAPSGFFGVVISHNRQQFAPDADFVHYVFDPDVWWQWSSIDGSSTTDVSGANGGVNDWFSRPIRLAGPQAVVAKNGGGSSRSFRLMVYAEPVRIGKQEWDILAHRTSKGHQVETGAQAT